MIQLFGVGYGWKMINDSNKKPSTGDILGFKIVGATSEEENQLIKILCYLPKSHRKAVKLLRIINESEWNDFLIHLSKAAGITSVGVPEPMLIRERCKDKLIYYALHEMAHAIWHNFLTEDERQDFLDMIELVRGDEIQTITWYADISSFNEHFAEAYAHYALKPSYLRRKEPDVYRWFKNYVFHGDTYLFLEEKLKSTDSATF